MKYEDIQYIDPALPIVFRNDSRHKCEQMRLHWHEPVELIYVYEGKLTVANDAQTCTVLPHTLVCIHSNHLHSYQTQNEVSRYYCLIVSAELLKETDLFRQNMPFVTQDDASLACFREIAELLGKTPPFYKEEVKGLIFQLFARLCRLGGGETGGRDRKMTAMVKDAIVYIENHFAEEITVEQIASAVGISRYHLCHIFKTVTGKTVAGFWTSVRCDKARQMLSRGSSVGLAAEQTGFRSVSHFSKVYKEYFGHTPGKEGKL